MGLRDLLTVRPGAAGALVAEPEGQGFLFGGLTLGLALRAAAHSVAPGMVAKSCHAYFLGAGKWGVPTHLEVDEEHNGRRFSVRHVRVRQEDRTVGVMTASFHVPAGDVDWQVAPRLDGPGPEALMADQVRLPGPDLIEVRRVDSGSEPYTGPAHPYWARAIDPLGEDPMSHAAALAFISDYLVILSVLAAGTPVANPTAVRTVDHSLWFHRPVNVDDWHLFRADPVSIANGKGLVHGSVHARSGVRVASFAQEVNIPA
jgi:acyl-CoA thioesterase